MYWSERQKQLYKAMEKDEAKLKKRLSSFYDREFAKLDKSIAAFYSQFGDDNIIEYRNLMEKLSEADKTLLFEQFDGFAKKYPQYAHLLPIRENIYKLNRLEGLQYSVRMSQLEIGAMNNEQIRQYLQKQAERGVNAAAEAMGFGKNFNMLNGNIAAKFVGTPWSNGKNFSQRIWENADKLSQYLNNDIATGMARGVNYSKMSKMLQDRFGKVTRNDAYRLIFTEGTYVMAEASMAPFEEDFEKYRISTVGDGRVCPICRDLSGQVFNIKDRQPGVNFPPLHPWCRCTFTIEVDDWDAWMDEYERKHKNRERGESVINNMTEKNGNISNVIPMTQNVHTVKRRMAEQLKSLSKSDIEAVNSYTGFNAQWINKALATGRNIDKYSKEIKQLDKALDKGISTDTFFVQRKTIPEYLNAFPKGSKITKEMMFDLIGRELTNKIYTSTSMEPFEWTGRNVTLLLKIPKGIKGVLYIKDIAKDKYKYQEEVLLKRNTKYIITSIEETKDGYSMIGEVVE